MSLRPVESKDLSDFLRTGEFTEGLYFYSVSISAEPHLRAIAYYDRLDALYFQGKIDKTPGAATEVHCAIDPLGLDNTSPVSRYGYVTGAKRAGMFCVGEWDRVANTQALYTGDNVSQEFWPMDPTSFFIDDSVNLHNFLWYVGGGGTGVIGGWNETNGALGNFAFFETWGYAVRGVAEVRHTDNQLYRGLALIDLSDGKATLLDVPTYFTNAPRALFETTEFNGESFSLGVPQFVPDDDSLPAAPKGRLFLYQGEYLGDAAPGPDLDNYVYLKVIEWNPLGVAPAEGTPNRVHLREILMTRMNFISHQAFGTNLNSLGVADDGGLVTVRRLKHFYHSPSRTIITWNDMKWGVFDNERGIVRTSITPELDQLEAPTAQTEVETNKTVVFKARGMGDLGEGIAGVTGTWSLARRSTVDEALDTSGAPAFNIVAHPPIDDDTLVVEYLGAPLTEGVHYSVVEATGTITWMGAHSPPAASGYTASYRHSTVSATPPHGTLLQETTETDVDGFCESRVQYADDDELAGDRDRITVSITDV